MEVKTRLRKEKESSMLIKERSFSHWVVGQHETKS